MTIFDLVLLINRLTTLYYIGLIFISGLLGLILLSVAWSFFRTAAFDCIGIYSSFQTAKFNTQDRPAQIAFEREQGRAQIANQSAALQLGSAAMWQAGVYNVEIEERK